MTRSTKISLRAQVNDKRGNPVEIPVMVVWRVEDTAKAAFDVDDYGSYVPDLGNRLGQGGFGGVKLFPGSQQQDLVVGLDFFVRAGIDDVRAVALNGDNTRAGTGAEFEFANEFAHGWRASGDRERLQVSLAQQRRERRRRRRVGGRRRLCEGLLQ